MFQTEILSIFDLAAQKKAAKILEGGDLVAIPTETVYGLAADAKNKEAINKIFLVKQRPCNHPLILHIPSEKELPMWADSISQEAYLLAEHFWPGPLTMVFKKKASVLDEITGGLETVAIRVPRQEQLRAILCDLNTGVVAPSANPHKKLSPTSAEQVYQGLCGKIPLILDGGDTEVGIESTIVDMTQNRPTILRKGPISRQMLEKVLNQMVLDPTEHAIQSPGNMKEHYQPHTKSSLLTKEELISSLDTDEKSTGYLFYSDIAELENQNQNIKLSSQKEEYAAKLYQSLYRLDKIGLKKIIIEKPPLDPQWSDVIDRLTKATYQS